MSTTVTSPACVLAGRDPQPRLGGVEGRRGVGAHGRARRPRRSTRRRRSARRRRRRRVVRRARVDRVDRRRGPGSRGSPAKPGAEDRVDDRGGALQRAGPNGTRRPARAAARGWRGASPRSSSPVGEQQHVDVAARARAAAAPRPARRRRCCPCRRRPRPGPPGARVATSSASPAPARSISSMPGIPRLLDRPLVGRPLLLGVGQRLEPVGDAVTARQLRRASAR